MGRLGGLATRNVFPFFCFFLLASAGRDYESESDHKSGCSYREGGREREGGEGVRERERE